MTIFWVKSSIILCKLSQIFFLPINFQIFNSVIFMAEKKVGQNLSFHLLSFVAVFRSGTRDPGSEMDKKQDQDLG